MVCERKAMTDRNLPLPIAHQAKIVGIRRGAVYYVSRQISEANLALMRRIDELRLEHPFVGAIAGDEGFKVCGLHRSLQFHAADTRPIHCSVGDLSAEFDDANWPIRRRRRWR